MPIDDRTINKSYALPNASNDLSDDVLRLRAALEAIDADINATITSAAIDALRTEILGAPPATLNTLQELAAAIGNDPTFATTVAAALSQRVNVATTVSPGTGLVGGGALSGNITLSLSTPVTTSLGLADSAVQPARQVFTSNGLTGGGDLSANRTIQPVYASQPEAEAGTATNVILNPLRGAQQIAALRPWSSQALAEAGTDNVTAMTPLRTAQQVAAKPPGIPVVAKTSAYTLADSDTGKTISTTTGGVTVPSSLAASTTVCIWNNSASNRTITQGAGMTLYFAADGTTGNRTLAGRGMATVTVISAGVAVIGGAGLS